jgi:hypothetical protein
MRRAKGTDKLKANDTQQSPLRLAAFSVLTGRHEMPPPIHSIAVKTWMCLRQKCERTVTYSMHSFRSTPEFDPFHHVLATSLVSNGCRAH